MLELKNIAFSYKDKKQEFQIIKNLNLEISTGEFVSLIGPSGCGKTTLVNLIAGYLSITSGQILCFGQEINSPSRDRIVISQADDLFYWMTVYDNLKLISANDKKINELLELTGLEKFKKYYPEQLSGGMKKRLSLARALAVDSKFIIMDEPFASQDYRIKKKLYQDLLDIAAKKNVAILLITHDLDEALGLSDRILVMGGSPASILGEFKIPFSEIKDLNIEEMDEYIKLKNQLKKLGYNI
jgi:ABC-type nitrate/sulfonate/bicarbonate transport system ATPase subunit